MKVRHGFVSNSSSSSFLVVLDETNRHMANYDWIITEEVTAWNDTKIIWCDEPDAVSPSKEVDTEEYLISQGFTKAGRRYDRDRYERTRKISNTVDTGLGRATSICFGEDLVKYAELLREDGYTPDLLEAIMATIEKYGVANVMLLRESDEEGDGSLPKELLDLTNKAVHESEYH